MAKKLLTPASSAHFVAYRDINMAKKNIILLSAFYDPFMSGAEQMVKELAERLGGEYQITIITGRYKKRLAKKETRNNYKIIRVGIAHPFADKILYPFLAIIKARQLKPDILHAIMESYAGVALVVAKYFFPKPKRILTLQSGDLDSAKKQKNFFIRLFFRRIHHAPHHVTAISSFLAKRAENLGVKPADITIVPNGIDLAKIPRHIGRRSGQVICVARLSWEKAHKYLLSAWPKVKNKFPQASLVLVGDGPEHNNIEKLIDKLGIKDSVVLKGNLEHDKVLAEICASEVFICPSLAEGLGIVFIEAQACGVSVIGTRVGGIPDVIQDQENGLLIKAKSEEAIAEAIIDLLQNSEKRERLARQALVSVEKFNWPAIIKDIEKIYLKI